MTYTIKSSNTAITFDSKGQVVSVQDRLSNYDFLSAGKLVTELWQMALIKPVSYRDPLPELIIPDLAYENHEWWVNRFEYQGDKILYSNDLPDPEIIHTGDHLELTWTFRIDDHQSNTFKVTVTGGDDSDFVEFHVSVNLSADWAIKRITCPQIRGFGNIESPGDDAVLYPFNWGILRKNPLEEQINFIGQYPSGMNAMQMGAIFHQDKGFYLGVRDPKTNHTGFDIQYVEGDVPAPVNTDRWYVEKDTPEWLLRDHVSLEERINNDLKPSLNLRFQHWPEQCSNWTSDYPIVIKSFTGNWFDASQIHKTWVEDQRWCQKGKLKSRTDNSSTLLETDLWFVEYGFHPGSFTPEPAWDFHKRILKLLDYFEQPFGLHWYNWHNFSWHSNFPSHAPVVEGFEEVLKDLQDKGVVVMPYCQGRLLYRDRPALKQEATHASIEVNGQPYYEKYTPGDDWPLALCPGDQWSQEQWHEAARMLWRQYNVPGVYFDQIAAMPPSLCYHQGHGHKLGGGTQYWEGYNQALQKMAYLKQEDPNRFLASECMTDAFIDSLDMFLAFVPPLEDNVPLFSSVYNEYTTTMGRNCPGDMMKDSQLFVIGQGELFLFGGQVGWTNPSILGHEKAAAFLKALAKFRPQIRNYLNYGKMLAPLQSITQADDIEVLFPRNLTAHHKDLVVKRTPVINTVWQDGNKQLILLLNEDIKGHDVSFKLPAEGVKSCKLHRLDKGTSCHDLPADGVLNLSIDSLSIVAIEYEV